MVGSVDVDGQDRRDPVRLLRWVGPVVLELKSSGSRWPTCSKLSGRPEGFLRSARCRMIRPMFGPPLDRLSIRSKLQGPFDSEYSVDWVGYFKDLDP